jgi:hypothetical protein
MNKKILPYLAGAALLVAMAGFTGCTPSRVYANKKKQKEKKEDRESEYDRDYGRTDRDDRRYDRDYDYERVPPPASGYSRSSLIIAPRPGFVMQRYPDGRFYHRSPSGLLYWKGYDNRFYLDRTYLNRVRYSQGEYEQWRDYARANQRRRY